MAIRADAGRYAVGVAAQEIVKLMTRNSIFKGSSALITARVAIDRGRCQRVTDLKAEEEQSVASVIISIFSGESTVGLQELVHEGLKDLLELDVSLSAGEARGLLVLGGGSLLA